MHILLPFLDSIHRIYTVFNWLDFIIIIVFLFYAFEGFERGFVLSLIDLIGFVTSFLVGLKFYSFFGKLLSSLVLMPSGFANALGFFIAAILAEMIINSLFVKVARPFYASKVQNLSLSRPGLFFVRVNHFLGIVPALISSAVLVSFLLTLIVALPFSPFLKQTIYKSKIGSSLLINTQGVEQDLRNVFGKGLDETLNFLTVEPKSNELIKLSFKTSNFHIDYASERKMFSMVNAQRTSRNIQPLSLDARLQAVARAHCEDMFKRGYFSHYTPEGLSPFDRMGEADISFTYAGENLAFAPNVELAMQGLMKSPGHRANILSVNFGRVGIGVIDGGIYGEMFCQEFTN
ncbi:MAG: CvpA family protein [Patescibacteria group bacterium]|nr:CvpA family protein [Patescibacteria group bacterium]